MRRILILLLLLCAPLAPFAAAQETTAYRFPIEEVSRLYAANFGEMRPGHFHAGIDIKTDGVEGKRLVAAADGYISRIVVQAGGYGRAVYLSLPDGTTIVYGHMQRFRDDLEAHMQRERYRRRSNSVDLWFDAARYPVVAGELLGYAGNSGSSSGPHLHYEIRRGKDQERINMVREGIIRPKDTLSPRFMKLHYVEIDTLDCGIVRRRPMESYAVVKSADGGYRLTRQEPLPVGRKGYFVVEVTDRRNEVYNTFSVWRVTASIDQRPYFEYRMDSFPYALSRTCDAVSCYALQLSSRNEVIRLAQLEGAPERFYPTLIERGLIRTLPGEQHTIALEIEDDCGNCSTLQFRVLGREEAFVAAPPTDSLTQPAFREFTSHYRLGATFEATLPADALYESTYVRPMAGEVAPVDSGVVVLSPAYRLFEEVRTPLFKPLHITLRAPIPQSLQNKAMIAVRNWRGKAALAGGSYADGAVSVSTRTVGDWFIVADTLPPTIEPRFTPQSNLAASKQLTFKVADNFSGVAKWVLTIDGEWVPCDRYPSRGILVWHIDRPAAGISHRAVLVVTDGAGNRTEWQGDFRW